MRRRELGLAGAVERAARELCGEAGTTSLGDLVNEVLATHDATETSVRHAIKLEVRSSSGCLRRVRPGLYTLRSQDGTARKSLARSSTSLDHVAQALRVLTTPPTGYTERDGEHDLDLDLERVPGPAALAASTAQVQRWLADRGVPFSARTVRGAMLRLSQEPDGRVERVDVQSYRWLA